VVGAAARKLCVKGEILVGRMSGQGWGVVVALWLGPHSPTRSQLPLSDALRRVSCDASIMSHHGRALASGTLVVPPRRSRCTSQNVHYHEGMQAGENTLNALCARVVTRGMAKRGAYSAEGFLQECARRRRRRNKPRRPAAGRALAPGPAAARCCMPGPLPAQHQWWSAAGPTLLFHLPIIHRALHQFFLWCSYVAFMTTPGSHNDTYAESYHRDFFRQECLAAACMHCAARCLPLHCTAVVWVAAAPSIFHPSGLDHIAGWLAGGDPAEQRQQAATGGVDVPRHGSFRDQARPALTVCLFATLQELGCGCAS
jgi:hypothetical protein